MIRSLRLVVVIMFVLVLVPCLSQAQVTTGTPAFGSFGGGPDSINLANLNSHIAIPVLHKAGRGTGFTYDLSYDSSVWYPVAYGSSKSWQPVINFGWRGVTEVETGYVSYSYWTGQCEGDDLKLHTFYIWDTWQYHDSFGTTHDFPNVVLVRDTWSCSLYNQQNTDTAGDGSGYSINAVSSTHVSVYTSRGKAINAPLNVQSGAGSFADRNGNLITVNSSGQFFDTLSATTPVLTVTGSGTPASPITFTYVAPSGGNASYTMKYAAYTVQTKFSCSGVSEYGPTSTNLVSEIDLPDGSKYTFAYEPTPGTPANVTGRIASVTLPTGGTISYTYQGGSNGIICADGSTAGLKRYTPDTGSSAYWNFARTIESGAASVTTVTDPTPQANQTIVQFQGNYETQRDSYQGAAPTFSTFPIPETTLQTASLLKEIQITSTLVGAILQRNITTHLSGASSWANSKTSQSIYKYSSTGSLIEQDDYDYGTGSPGSLLKKTAITYATLTNITSFRQQVTVTDGTGATVSQTNYNYGDTVTATSSTPQHTTPSGSRGNLLSVNYYTQGSTFLTKSYTYFDTGNVQTVTDVNGAQTTYTYGPSGCPNSFPTSLAEPLSLSSTMTWNCTGGVQTAVTDENGQSASKSYTQDPNFWRQESATDPTNATASFTYASRTQAEAVLPIVSGSSAYDKITTLDSLGRPSVSQIRETPNGSTFDTIETDYDVVGRPTRNTLAFSTTAIGQKSSTAPGWATVFDALGRITSGTNSGSGTITNVYSQNDVVVTRGPAPTGENVKKHQSEYDALNRVTSVCEITTGTGSGTCAQATSQTGFWTKYSYDPLGRLKGITQNAQSSSTQSRSFVYDLMGRMTSETEAESGTTTYTYDTDTTCGTYKGDLVKRVDAVGNVTCYSYDALHRQLSVTYPSGSYASVTSNKYFVYDTATVNGVAMSNGKTHMVEAYTATTQNGTKLTDVGFSYTVRGEPSDIYEKTPNSGGYYHLAEQYWANGTMKQLSGLSSLPTFTFNLDGEGRTYHVSASTGQNPVTNTVFNTASLPTSVTFGSTDTDSFSYDPNTNRMTQYQFTVNGQSLKGILTWNANSSLQNLNITDALNSSDTQSCSYTYDDMMRIQSANCGSVWSQTFSYDPFGNIAKSGTATFNAVYSASTNRITSVGSFTPTYDANGNTLTDPAHTYSWNSDGKPVTIDNVNMTYDALGRMVEQNRSGVYTQFLYGPHGGKFAIMSGQTLQKAIVPLVGGAQAVYNASGLLYYGHSDHLGSIRLGSTSTRTMLFDVAYAPFGETYAPSGSTDPAFTNQRQDTVTGLFDFPAREYSNEGRWSSPDPSGPLAFHLTDPQSLNRYAYARNTPLSQVDSTGLDPCDEEVCVMDQDPPGSGPAGSSNPLAGNVSPGPSDPTAGGSQGNSGGGCGSNDPACIGPVPMAGGGGDPLNPPLSTPSAGPAEPSYPNGVIINGGTFTGAVGTGPAGDIYGGGALLSVTVVDQNGSPMAGVTPLVPTDNYSSMGEMACTGAQGACVTTGSNGQFNYTLDSVTSSDELKNYQYQQDISVGYGSSVYTFSTSWTINSGIDYTRPGQAVVVNTTIDGPNGVTIKSGKI